MNNPTPHHSYCKARTEKLSTEVNRRVFVYYNKVNRVYEVWGGRNLMFGSMAMFSVRRAVELVKRGGKSNAGLIREKADVDAKCQRSADRGYEGHKDNVKRCLESTLRTMKNIPEVGRKPWINGI